MAHHLLRLPLAFVLALALAAGSAAAQVQPDPTPKAQAVVQQLVQQKFAEIVAQLQPALAASLTEDRLRGAWVSVLQAAGAFKQGGRTRSAEQNGLRAVIITCDFERAQMDIQVVLDSMDRIAGLTIRPATNTADYSPPPYATASAYTESEVTVGAGEWALPGTLTMPNGPGPFPVVVLVHGSGPSDRDESIGPNKLFKDLALGLGSQGIAVLRYEKRTRQYGQKVAALGQLTVKEEVIDDVLAAIALARATPKVDSARVFVLGHSVGGMLVPRIAAAANPAVRGLISMAGATTPLEQAIVNQTRYISSADGSVTPAEQQQIDAAEKLAVAVRALTPADGAAALRVSGAPASYWLDLRSYDPPAAARSVKQPLLFLQGERDYQVPMTDFARWQAALGERRDVTFHSYPALNHFFLPGAGPSLPAEYLLPGHVPETVVRDIAAWILLLR